MLATTLLFYDYDWPRSALARITCRMPRNNSTSCTDTAAAAASDDAANDDDDDDDDDMGQNTTNAKATSKVRRSHNVVYLALNLKLGLLIIVNFMKNNDY